MGLEPDPRAVRGQRRPDRRVRARRRRLPGRPLAALLGAGRRSRRSRSTAACARSTPRRTCTSSSSATSRSPAPRRSRWSRSTGRRVETRPIAGTYPRGASEEEDRRQAEALLADPKERAEHVMLVDLGPQRPRPGLRVRHRRASTSSWWSRPTRTSSTSSARSRARCATGIGAMDALRAVAARRHALRARRRSARCRSSTSSSRTSAAPTAARSATWASTATSTRRSTSAPSSSRTGGSTSRPAAARSPTRSRTTSTASRVAKAQAMFEAVELADEPAGVGLGACGSW